MTTNLLNLRGNKMATHYLSELKNDDNKYVPQYLLKEIPNDEEGRTFIKQLKKYLNKDGWEVKVRGQHLKKGLNWKKYQYGQPIDCSTHLRLYVKWKRKVSVPNYVSLDYIRNNI
tara:strand:- start:1283 stop:1627 length:345 start_codon:yes stop_codon:yes gene_type:complete